MLRPVSSRPPFDPWLNHLRRDRRGLPVPYVNLWQREDGVAELDRVRLDHDPNVGMRAVFQDDADLPVPNFTKQNLGRQRECMTVGLCQVCARPVPWSRRNIVVSSISVEWVDVGGREVPVVFEPWLDDRCAEIATRWCPALIRRTREDNLTLIRIRSQREAQLVVSKGWVEGPFEEETRRNPVAMWAKVALLNARIERAPETAAGATAGSDHGAGR